MNANRIIWTLLNRNFKLKNFTFNIIHWKSQIEHYTLKISDRIANNNISDNRFVDPYWVLLQYK